MRHARILLLASLVALAGTAALGAAPASAVTVNCGIKRYSLVFWPKGNRAITLPHIDFYKLTTTFPKRDHLASIDREGGGVFVPRCKRTSHARFRSVTRPARTTRATTLRCRFPRNATIAVHPISNEDEELGIHILLGRRTVMFAELFEHGSPRVTYDKGYCRRARLPS